jgi:hypothetical protein
VLDEAGTTYSATTLLRQGEVKSTLSFALFAVIVLSLMLLALVNYYPGA